MAAVHLNYCQYRKQSKTIRWRNPTLNLMCRRSRKRKGKCDFCWPIIAYTKFAGLLNGIENVNTGGWISLFGKCVSFRWKLVYILSMGLLDGANPELADQRAMFVVVIAGRSQHCMRRARTAIEQDWEREATGCHNVIRLIDFVRLA